MEMTIYFIAVKINIINIWFNFEHKTKLFTYDN